MVCRSLASNDGWWKLVLLFIFYSMSNHYNKGKIFDIWSMLFIERMEENSRLTYWCLTAINMYLTHLVSAIKFMIKTAFGRYILAVFARWCMKKVFYSLRVTSKRTRHEIIWTCIILRLICTLIVCLTLHTSCIHPAFIADRADNKWMLKTSRHHLSLMCCTKRWTWIKINWFTFQLIPLLTKTLSA